jgi:hypothetical protein
LIGQTVYRQLFGADENPIGAWIEVKGVAPAYTGAMWVTASIAKSRWPRVYRVPTRELEWQLNLATMPVARNCRITPALWPANDRCAPSLAPTCRQHRDVAARLPSRSPATEDIAQVLLLVLTLQLGLPAFLVAGRAGRFGPPAFLELVRFASGER